MNEPLRNPFRSEGDAFRLLMVVVAAGAVVVAIAVLTRPLVGALVGLALVALALWRTWGWVRAWFAGPPGTPDQRSARKEGRK
jgi:hypothetical protein